MGWLQKSENNNPWGKKPDNQGPPDLDEVFKNLMNKFLKFPNFTQTFPNFSVTCKRKPSLLQVAEQLRKVSVKLRKS